MESRNNKRVLTQLYMSKGQKTHFKAYVDNNYHGRMRSMSKVTSLLIDILLAAEKEIDYGHIYDETTFKEAIVQAIADHPHKQALIEAITP